MNKKRYHQASFLLSAPSLEHLSPDEGAEVAFIGCSNVGKSSAINAITGISGLARSSKTPGRTQMINLFQLDEYHRLVDLPGYGYAKVPLQLKQRFQALINLYLQARECLKGLIVLMDIRHPFKEADQRIIQWSIECDVPIHVLLTKADKLGYGAASTALKQAEQTLKNWAPSSTVQLFSSLDHTGIDTVHTILNQWLSAGKNA
jgi:GTP-binding protein